MTAQIIEIERDGRTYWDEVTVITALCLWECAIENVRDGDDTFYEWLKQDEGAFMARQNALELAPWIDKCWDIVDAKCGKDYFLGAFDWDFIPYIAQFLVRLPMIHVQTDQFIVELANQYIEEWVHEYGT